ncbi:MAG: hypothetical protein GC154_16555 [bacterium]|nr:hypothetical protein [bacterium]
MKKSIFTRSLFVGLAMASSLAAVAQTEPTFTISDPVNLFAETATKEAGLAINEKTSEVLFVTIDTAAIDNDPITGEPAQTAVTGFYYDPVTLTQKGDPFVIVGNPRGSLQKLSVTYNPVNDKYFIAVAADGYSPSGARVPLMAIVNSYADSQANGPIYKAWSWDEGTAQNYQDTAVASSSKNGNLMYVSEYSPAGEGGEGVIGLLYDMDGNLLVNDKTRLDQLEPDRDEDDPDVYYLPENDVFLFITNIDPSTSKNRIAATAIQPVPDANGNLQQGTMQIVSKLRKDFSAGHPSAIENPFTGEFIGALDYDNGAEGGDIFYFNIGPAPNYTLTESQPQIPYLEAAGGVPLNQRHPRLAADTAHGVIVISTNANGNWQGMGFTLLGPDGHILPGRPDDLYRLVETPTSISNDANYHDVKYDPNSKSFLIIYATSGGFTNVVRLSVTSDHLPADVNGWMVY